MAQQSPRLRRAVGPTRGVCARSGAFWSLGGASASASANAGAGARAGLWFGKGCDLSLAFRNGGDANWIGREESYDNSCS